MLSGQSFFSPQHPSCTFINLTFDRELNNAAISGILLLIYILRYPKKNLQFYLCRPGVTTSTASYCREVNSLCLFWKHCRVIWYNELSSLVIQWHECNRITRLATRSHRFTFEIPRPYQKFSYLISSFTYTFLLWNSLRISCFPVN